MKTTLSLEAALTAMRKPDVRLVRMNGGRAAGYYVVGAGGGHVDDGVAAKIMNHPLVRGNRDGLFPGHDQTWRMVQSALTLAVPHH